MTAPASPPYRRGINFKGLPDFGQGVAGLVAVRCDTDGALAQLPAVYSAIDATILKMGGDSPFMNPEIRGDVHERPSRPVVGDDPVDFDLVEPPLDRPAARDVPIDVKGWVG